MWPHQRGEQNGRDEAGGVDHIIWVVPDLDPAYAVLQHLGLKVRPQGPARDPFENTGGFGEAQVGSIERAHAHLQPKDTSVASCRFMALEYAPGTSPATPIRPRIVNCPRKRVNHISITPPDLDAATQAGWMCWVPSRSTKSPSRTSWSVCSRWAT